MRDFHPHPHGQTAEYRITRAFVQAIEQFVADQQIPLITFEKGERKDGVAARLRRTFKCEEGVVFVGKAQEKCRLSGTEKRYNPKTPVVMIVECRL
jgi:hypothetical protein